MDLDNGEAGRVRRGAALLDKIIPGWYKQVDLQELDMGCGMMCILGQTFGTKAEKSLAKEMYPEEWEETLERIVSSCGTSTFPDERAERKSYFERNSGYGIASSHGMLDRIFNRLGWFGESQQKELLNLKFICKGHDNRCHWSQEIADRLAQDEIKEEAAKDKTDAA